ncbi:MAG: hypothetical protein D6775_10560 [Caldilineae bacterium]|nr:MAG: hypothetical protein D6775_10560 [Caldilineae bacterium]
MRSKQRWILLLGLVLVLLLAACQVPPPPVQGGAAPAAESAKPEKVTVAVGAQHAIVYLPFDVAYALGYYEEEGLDVDLQFFRGGSDSANALIGGSAEFSGNAIDHALKAQIKGKDLRMVVNFMDTPCVTLVARQDLADEVKSVADLKGRKVGITRKGSATHILAVYTAIKAGLSPDDIEIVDVGASTMPAAIEAQEVAAAWGAAPYTTQVIKAGKAFALLDLCKLEEATKAMGGGYPFTGMLTRSDVIADKPEVVQKMVNAIVKAQTFITSHTAEEIVNILPKEVTGEDVETYTEALKANLPAFNRNGGIIDPAGLERLVDLHRTFGTLGPDDQVDIDALYDNSFAEKAQ